LQYATIGDILVANCKHQDAGYEKRRIISAAL
jgi:hypothetical protein